MTTGLSGTYGINGTDLTLQPTTGKWVERQNYGVDGGGHPVYSPYRSFELSWELISPQDVQQLINFYNLVGNTGTVTSCLPEWGANDYQFKNYSGTTIQEPTVEPYFQGYTQTVKMLILRIQTN